ncbi:MAG: cupin domain-containing protein [Limisphaerales bacterium]
MSLRPAIVPAGINAELHAFGERVTLHLTGEQTNGQLTTWTEITPPGGGPPPHYHLQEDEHFVVLEGTVSFFQNDTWREVGPGGAVFMPRKVIHAFKNVGTQPSRMLITTTPSGFETFFAHCADEFKQPGGPDMNRILQIGAEHGIHFVTQ